MNTNNTLSSMSMIAKTTTGNNHEVASNVVFEKVNDDDGQVLDDVDVVVVPSRFATNDILRQQKSSSSMKQNLHNEAFNGPPKTTTAATSSTSEIFNTITKRPNTILPLQVQKQKQKQQRRLDFNSIQENCGIRQQEINLLLNYALSPNPKPAIWIEAEAGVGKSWLLSKFQDHLQPISSNSSSEDNKTTTKAGSIPAAAAAAAAVTIFGKFEERTAASEPFAALSSAISMLVEHILLDSSQNQSTTNSTSTADQETASTRQQQKQHQSVWAEGLTNQLGPDLDLLLGIMPVLQPIFDDYDNNNNNNNNNNKEASQRRKGGSRCEPSLCEEKSFDDDDFGKEEDAFGDFNSRELRFERFRLAFRSLIRYVCDQLLSSSKKTLVLILDDFHWIDPDSLQIIKSLMDDTRKPSNFLLVAATRPLDNYPHLIDLHRKMTTTSETNPSGGGGGGGGGGIGHRSSSKVFRSSMSSFSYNSFSQHEFDSKLKIMGVPRLSLIEISDILKTLLNYNNNNNNNRQTQQQQHPHDHHEADDDITEFAHIVKSKTQGNSFVVIQFIRLLERLGHIYFDDDISTEEEDNGKWVFNLDEIELVDRISDNVSEVVAHNIESGGNKRRRSALMVAASFGVSQFEVSTIVHAVSVLNRQEESDEDDVAGGDGDGAHHRQGGGGVSTGLSSSSSSDMPYEEYEDPYIVRRRVDEMSCELTAAAVEGYVEETSPGHFRFAHDRIRESAYSLLPEGISRKEVHLRVGRQLRSWMDTQSELGLYQSGFSKDSLLLHATKQLNAGATLIDDDWELLDLVDLNYQAAELAAKKTAFHSSIEYLQVGLRHLGNEKVAWERRYDRAIRFCVALTRMQYSCGLLEECWETSDIVIRHGKNFRDKSRIYHTRVLCLMQKELMDEALNHVLEIFEIMEQPMPRRFVLFHVAREFFKTRKFLKDHTDEELLSLPPVYDEDLEIQLDLLQSLAEICFLHGKFEYVVLVSLRYLNLVAERGNYPRSFFAYQLHACYFKPQMGDLQGSKHYASIANILSERQRAAVPGFAARSYEMYLGYVQHWHSSAKETIPDCFDAFQRLWAAGFVDTALMDASTLLQHLFAGGESIEKAIKECDTFCEAFKDYQQMGHWYINASQYQALKNFQGDDAGGDATDHNPAILSGTVMDAEACKQSWKVTPNLPALYNFQFWSMVVGYHFGDYHGAKRHIKSMRADLFEDGSCHLVPLRPFYTCLVYLALYRGTRKGKYRRRAMKSSKIIQGWIDSGAKTFEYMYKLVEAEDLSQKRGSTVDSTIAAYDKAIKAVTELELIHHMALANELAAAYLVDQTKNQLAIPYLTNAAECWKKWGAFAKVRDLRFRFNGLVRTTSS